MAIASPASTATPGRAHGVVEPGPSPRAGGTAGVLEKGTWGLHTDRPVGMVGPVAARVYPSARDRILDAAERLILTRGIGQLAVEAVAAEAKVSKGGFFHHFATKDEMLLAILDRLTTRTNAEIEAAAAADPEPRGARLRAQIALTFDGDRDFVEHARALAIAFIETASVQPALARRARELHAEIFARDTAEDIPLGRAMTIQLALDGHALAEAMGTIPLDPAHRGALRDTLMALARPEASPPLPARPGKKARTAAPDREARATKKGRQS